MRSAGRVRWLVTCALAGVLGASLAALIWPRASSAGDAGSDSPMDTAPAATPADAALAPTRANPARAALVAGAPARRRVPARLDVPPTWRPLPAVQQAAVEASDGVRVLAWGDPADGGFALVEITRGSDGASPRAVHDEIRAAFADADTDVVDWRADGAESRFWFRRGGFGGLARAVVVAGDAEEGTYTVYFASCFYNGRYPETNADLCRDMIDRFEITP